MEVILENYTDKYKDDLRKMLIDFSMEVYETPEEEALDVDLEEFINYYASRRLYIVLVNTVPIGFISYSINTFYNMRPSTLSVDFTYILPKYRRGKVTLKLALHQLETALLNKVPLEHYYASKNSKPFCNRMEGKELYSVYIFEEEVIRKQFNKLRRYK